MYTKCLFLSTLYHELLKAEFGRWWRVAEVQTAYKDGRRNVLDVEPDSDRRRLCAIRLKVHRH